MHTISLFYKMALMSLDEALSLEHVALQLSDNSVVVEVGCFMGGSAAIIAHTNKSISVHSFDLFEDDTHTAYRGPNQYKLFSQLLQEKKPVRSLDNVRKILSYSNIHLYKGRSPVDFVNWDTPIDMYFEDSLHTNPSLSMNIKFWEPKLKEGGYLLMHDCRPFLPKDHFHRFIDVEYESEKLLANGYKKISHVGALLVLQKCISTVK
jgi:hypothetical protein